MAFYLSYEAWFQAALSFLVVLGILASRDLLMSRGRSGRIVAGVLWLWVTVLLLRHGLLLLRILHGNAGMHQLPALFTAVSETLLAGFLLLSFRRRWFAGPGA